MRNRPPNWHEMDYHQQEAWRREEREREDAEYRVQEAREELERQHQHERQLKENHRAELADVRDNRDRLLEECRVANDRWQHALRFIDHAGLTADYNTWAEPVLADEQPSTEESTDKPKKKGKGN